ncbi:MAG TPA: hypothetical protein VFP34_13085 [Microlunatus sp.]|nr:hypothetical protein [Microlunatus sp.]
MDEESTPATSGTERAHRLLRSHDAPDLLYGAVVAGSVLAVSSAHAPSSTPVALATIGVTLIYWLAHVYVDAVGNRYRDQGRSMVSRVAESMRDSREVLVGCIPPIAIFLIAKLFGADTSTAALVALWFTAILLVAAGAGAAYLAGVRGLPLVIESAISGMFGLLVVGLKFLLH